ncbi:MAG: hypothetical protein A3I63_02945 [Betaproteobacteria bacterium RIFCSPLOWO2_02_FULL_66_14]|nr:MAG: hypothetical protein A3I63_02945 [Betaproteobacteria bacterium RIFCSPLOWO2_02_FULL_66_14]
MKLDCSLAGTSPLQAVARFLSLVLLLVAGSAGVQAAERSGKQVVDAVCSSCHATGAKGSPRIGDRKAWSTRAFQGLTSLTDHALKGIREMPAHGGDLKLSDLEIARAVTYMVNRSGGSWIEPATAADLMAERGGQHVVEIQCSKCHAKGEGGAPRIGDREAWRPRLSQGVEALVRSAVRGHGGMPPRGNRADLTDAELRSAILYMYNPVVPAKSAPAPREALVPAGMHKVVGGLDIYLGFVPAEALRKYPEGSYERVMHGGVPGGDNEFHANVTVLDRVSKAPIAKAKVEVQVEQPGLTSETQSLEPVVINRLASYGNYVKLKPKTSYVVTVRVRTAESPLPVEARFQYRQY